MNTKNVEQFKFIQEELVDAKRALFSANNVRQIRFLQNKINYLMKISKQFENKLK